MRMPRNAELIAFCVRIESKFLLCFKTLPLGTAGHYTSWNFLSALARKLR